MSSGYLRRIHNEIEDLRTNHPYNIGTEYSENKVIVTIDEKLKYIISSTYPFEKPDVFYNEKPYKQSLRIPSPRFSQIMSKNKIECFCCATALCTWSPMYKMLTIINEIQLNKDIKQGIIYRVMMEELDTNPRHKQFNISEIKMLILGFLL